jgi:hypothetical protein
MFFEKNGINVGRKFAKIMKILDKIDDVKSRGVIYSRLQRGWQCPQIFVQ